MANNPLLENCREQLKSNPPIQQKIAEEHPENSTVSARNDEIPLLIHGLPSILNGMTLEMSDEYEKMPESFQASVMK